MNSHLLQHTHSPELPPSLSSMEIPAIKTLNCCSCCPSQGLKEFSRKTYMTSLSFSQVPGESWWVLAEPGSTHCSCEHCVWSEKVVSILEFTVFKSGTQRRATGKVALGGQRENGQPLWKVQEWILLWELDHTVCVSLCFSLKDALESRHGCLGHSSSGLSSGAAFQTHAALDQVGSSAFIHSFMSALTGTAVIG